jgi:tetrahydromethanopterin S-methyltransferase subunit G
MTIMAAKLTKEHLEQIGEYLVEKFPAIRGGGKSKSYSRDFEIEIRERIVRVEEELKNQRDLILQTLNFNGKQFEQVDKRFEQVDRRFDQVDKRFEQMDRRFEEIHKSVDKRFTMMMWFTGLGLTLVTAFITGVTVLLK